MEDLWEQIRSVSVVDVSSKRKACKGEGSFCPKNFPATNRAFLKATIPVLAPCVSEVKKSPSTGEQRGDKWREPQVVMRRRLSFSHPLPAGFLFLLTEVRLKLVISQGGARVRNVGWFLQTQMSWPLCLKLEERRTHFSLLESSFFISKMRKITHGKQLVNGARDSAE